MAINAEARVRALRKSLVVLGSLALLAIIPAGKMPGFPEEALTDEVVAVGDKPQITAAT